MFVLFDFFCLCLVWSGELIFNSEPLQLWQKPAEVAIYSPRYHSWKCRWKLYCVPGRCELSFQWLQSSATPSGANAIKENLTRKCERVWICQLWLQAANSAVMVSCTGDEIVPKYVHYGYPSLVSSVVHGIVSTHQHCMPYSICGSLYLKRTPSYMSSSDHDNVQPPERLAS